MRTSILALCLFIVGAFAADSASQKLSVALAQLRSGYEVDRVVGLLEALYSVQNQHLQTLVDNWAATQPDLQGAVDSSNDLAAKQDGECQIISAGIVSTTNQISLYTRYVQQAQDSIARNEASLIEKESNRCAANLIFIDRLKDNQDTLALLTYLRSKVADPSFKNYIASSQPALFELKSVNKANMFSFLAKHHMRSLLQQYQGEDNLGYNADVRSDVGTGHVDNDQGALGLDRYTPGQVGDVDLFISQLVDLIDDLIAHIHSSNDLLRDAELESVEAFIEYKSQLARENAVLRKFIIQWSQHVTDLSTTLGQNQGAADECGATAQSLHDAANEKQAHLDEATSHFQTTKDSLESTMHLLENVISLYIEKVASASEVYKQKVDDWMAKAHYVEPANSAEPNVE